MRNAPKTSKRKLDDNATKRKKRKTSKTMPNDNATKRKKRRTSPPRILDNGLLDLSCPKIKFQKMYVEQIVSRTACWYGTARRSIPKSRLCFDYLQSFGLKYGSTRSVVTPLIASGAEGILRSDACLFQNSVRIKIITSITYCKLAARFVSRHARYFILTIPSAFEAGITHSYAPMSYQYR